MPATRTELGRIIDSFVAAFNDGELDTAMAHFADDAEYLPGNGSVHQGTAAIRAEFAPPFAGRFGTLFFDVDDTVIDDTARRVTIRWVCRIDLTGEHGRRALAPLRWYARARHGGRLQWRGVDVFHFDDGGRITGKYTYATFRRPLWERPG
ncbi:nuclear transport factor 2 family protein [Couchioplanes caeruleus]|uniref:YybH family protein n=1 Tax=Couchioplanes caeruleus TaxID=56438 RepID=UPI0020BFF6DC|nr:nuclear transport factor 2 family protein [Couchioplanes caeruleus]UQU61751.1 nuclear transport factor 2 family protein [Couchioplanes caeruleus]